MLITPFWLGLLELPARCSRMNRLIDSGLISAGAGCARNLSIPPTGSCQVKGHPQSAPVATWRG
jgi:hypothetical protein